jgi:WD40 repeat protein/serine/threonine protein kinase
MEAREDALMAYLEALDAGQPEVLDRLRELHPGLAEEAEEFLARESQLDRLFAPFRPAAEAGEPVLPPGTQINNYLVLEYLERGGMGLVYRAWQQGANREVALKMLRTGVGASADDVRGLRAEAENAARLDHPNIVPIFEVGDYQGQPYFSMKLIEGGSLARLPSGLADDPFQVAQLLLTIARAVHHAHQRGLLHRDLKPANILLRRKSEIENSKSETDSPVRAHRRPGGREPRNHAGGLYRISDYVPLVTDFGLAQHIGTVSEGKAGTPSYMAPEQASGEKLLSVAVDVYGLGAILYELLTGRPPFRGATVEETLSLIRTQPLVPPRVFWPRVPRDLEAICRKCLEKDPMQRYSSAEELAQDLERFLKYHPVQARPRRVPSRIALWVWRQPILAALVLTLVVLAGLGAGYWSELGKSGRLETLRNQVLYYKTILLAQYYLTTGQLNNASDALDQCPKELRQWEYHFLQRACKRNVVTLTGHAAQVRTIQYSLDGSTVLTAGEDGRVNLWDPVSGRLRLPLEVQLTGGVSACFCSDGSGLGVLTAAADQPVRLWDARTGQVRRTFSVNGTRVAAARQEPIVAWIDREKTLRVWRLDSPRPPEQAPAVAEAQDLLRRLPPGSSQVNALALSPDGRYVAIGGIGGLLQVWDTFTGKEPHRLVVPKSAGWTDIWALAFHTDGRHLAVGGIRPIVWDLVTGQPVLQYDGTSELTCSSLDFSSDGTRLAATFRDGQVRVWDAARGKTVLAPRKSKLQITSAVFSPDGRHLAWARGRDAVIEDLQRPVEPPGLVLRQAGQKIWALALSPDGRLLAARSATEVILWDRETGQRRWDIRLADEVASEVPLAFSPDGRSLTTGGKEETLQFWETDTGKPTTEVPARNTRFLTFAPRTAGWLLATTDGGNSVVLWRGDGGRKLVLQDAGVGEVRGLSFAPDGRRLAVCGSKGAVKIWDCTGPRPRPPLLCRGTTRSVWCVAFSPDGQQLAAGGADESVFVWDSQTGQELFTLPGHTGNIASVAFSPDGRRLASCSNDGAIKLWDPQTGHEVLTLTGHEHYVTGVAFSNDGRHLASCSHDGTVRLWDGTPVRE